MQQPNQGPENSEFQEQMHTSAKISLQQRPLCWTGEEQGEQDLQQGRRNRAGESLQTREAGTTPQGSLQGQMQEQARSSRFGGKEETSQGHQEGREMEERDKGGTERGQPGPRRRAGRTAPQEEGGQEDARLKAAELHQLMTRVQGQHGDKDGIHSSDVEMIIDTDPPPRGEYCYASHTLFTEVILETQLNPSSRSKGSIYNDIMASIGLDSPTPSHETRRGENSNTSPRAQLINTPICNSASSLIALGKHVLTPRQGRIWELRKKPPLGGQGNQFGGSLP